MGDRLWPKSLAVGRTREVRYARVLFHETGIHVGDGKPNGNRVATVTMGGPGGIRSGREHVEAMAHLLAAAPKMAEALGDAATEAEADAEWLKRWSEKMVDPEARAAFKGASLDASQRATKYRAALAKARGEDRS